MTLSDAERQRRHRERQRTGAVVAPTELLPGDIERLCDCGWLTEEDALNPTQLARALLTAWRKSPPVIYTEKSVTALRTGLFDAARITQDVEDLDE